MKRFPALFVTAATVFSLTLPAVTFVVAQDDTTLSGEQAQQGQRQGRGAQIRERLSEVKRNRVAHLWANMERKFQWAIDRLGRIADRIDSRTQKFEAKGADVTDAKAKLADARTQIDAAKIAFATAKADAETLKTSDDPKAAFETLRGDVKNVRDALKAAHVALVEAVKVLKGASTAHPAEPTTTDPPSPTPPQSGGFNE